MLLNKFLQEMIDRQASDLFVSAGLAVSAKIDGELTPLNEERLTPEASLEIVESAMNDRQKEDFYREKECNFAIATDEGRFRVSAFWQRDCAGMVLRRIVTKIPDVNDLGLPSVLTDIIMAKPALPYLDVIKEVNNQVSCPVAAYQVSGEYAMIKAAAQKNWIDENESIIESLQGIKRAGADIIITYFADAAATLITS